MEEHRIGSIAELTAFLSGLTDDQVIRGQTSNYLAVDQLPDLTTSFTRHGCVPPLMLKWTYYASQVLRVLGAVPTGTYGIELDQAILQHYGWRSFFIDVTKSAPVAAWFASHKFKLSRHAEMTEDYQEDFVILAHDTATYEPAAGEGHLYVISKAKAASHKIRFHDLTAEVNASDTALRFHRQQAGLLGVTTRLPPDILDAHLTVPMELLRAYAVAGGITSQGQLFPSRNEDIVLKLLLSVPWERRDNELPIYDRGLGLPEYDFQPVRHHPPAVAFYREFWLADHRKLVGEFGEAIFYKTLDEVFYYVPPAGPLLLPRVIERLQGGRMLVIESSGVIRLPESHESSEYAKGLVLQLMEQEVLLVRELAVSHPGTALDGGGTLAPWSFRMDPTGIWTRFVRQGDCPCNNPGRHEHHIVVLKIFEVLLGENKYTRISENEFKYAGL